MNFVIQPVVIGNIATIGCNKKYARIGHIFFIYLINKNRQTAVFLVCSSCRQSFATRGTATV